MSVDRVTCVVNHPQSLWITLWVSFRGLAQVTYHKGFFFDRSNFERSVFILLRQQLSVIFPLSRRDFPNPGAMARPAPRPRWIGDMQCGA